MELRVTSLFVFLHLSIAVTLINTCDARISKHTLKALNTWRDSSNKIPNKLKHFKHLDVEPFSDSSNAEPYVSSPFTLPPFDSLAPMPLPQNTPPYCENPPVSQQPPSAIYPSPMTYSTTTPPPPPQSSYSSPPILPIESPPPSPSSYSPGTPEYMPSPPSFVPNPPETQPGTPAGYEPNPPETQPGTPAGYEPSPPETNPGTPVYFPSPTGYTPSPPSFGPTNPGTPIYFPSPTGNTPNPPGYTPSSPLFGPGPPVFLPPVVYPPPAVPPPPYKGPSYALWCVAKPSVPDPIIQEAMNYACGSGADCGSIQQDGSCFEPDSLFAHASYAFNSYWQRTKVAGGTCDFGGTAILVTVDPSFDGCHFLYY